MRKTQISKSELGLKTRMNLLRDLEEGTAIAYCSCEIPERKMQGSWVNVHDDSCLVNEKSVMNGLLSLAGTVNIPVSSKRPYFRDFGEEFHFAILFCRIHDDWKRVGFEEFLEDRIVFHAKKVKKNQTGMFISEVGEAVFCGLKGVTQKMVDESNECFSRSLGEVIEKPQHEAFRLLMKGDYQKLSISNPVAEYNYQRLYLNL